MSKFSMKNLFSGSLRRRQTTIRILSLVLFAAVISFVLFEGTKTPVVLNANGEEHHIFTHADTVEDLLQEEDIDITEYDKVSPSLNTEIAAGMAVSWEQARVVNISVDGEQTNVWTTESNVRNILEEANIEVSEHDKLSVALDENLVDNKIDIQKAFEVTLVDGLDEKKVWSTSTTVANFLKQQDIKLNDLDRVENDLETVITPEEKIKIVRVEKVTDVVEEPLQFAVETKSDASLLKGKQKVVTNGEEGIVSRSYEVTKENGKEVAKVLKSEEVIKEPITKVVSVGTKVVTANVSRNDAPATSSKEFYVTATAYTPNCGGCSGNSATGIDLTSNPELKLIAVDPNVIPLGTKVWVEGYGYAIAGDTGGSIKGNKIDVLMHTKADAYKWGRKKVLIKILD
ncbi:MAG TPA: ubiquitin-like domain-containing protein [Ureibacillus sp.]|nr:ubiquitin-like domain-containing protein [Ureibacillus sp.]